MPSFSVLEMQEKTPDDFRRWAIGGSLVGAIAYTIVAVTVLSIRGTDAAVLDWVRANPGAIGYVSSGATIPAGVKVVDVK